MQESASFRQIPGTAQNGIAGHNEDRLLAGLVTIISRRIRERGHSDVEIARATRIARTTINRYRHADLGAPGITWRNIWQIMAYLDIDTMSAVVAVCLEDPASYHDPAYRNITHCGAFIMKRLKELVTQNESGLYRSAFAQISPNAVEQLAGHTINHVESRLRGLRSTDEHMVNAA